MRKLIILGGGSFARELYHWAKQHPDFDIKWRTVGFLDDNTEALDGMNYPIPIIGTVHGHKPEPDALYLCAIAKPPVKEEICRKLQSAGAEFLTLVHPSVIMGGNVTLGTGTVICPNCVLTCDIQIGDFTMLNCGATIGHDVRIGNFCTINGNAELTGCVTLGDRVFVGSHVTTNPGTKVQNDARLGFGSAVLGHIKSGRSVIGIPAREI
ncbi:MAG: acetyltransferase [Opitutales bacterium]